MLRGETTQEKRAWLIIDTHVQSSRLPGLRERFLKARERYGRRLQNKEAILGPEPKTAEELVLQAHVDLLAGPTKGWLDMSMACDGLRRRLIKELFR